MRLTHQGWSFINGSSPDPAALKVVAEYKRRIYRRLGQRFWPVSGYIGKG